METTKLSTQQIGKCGELLVQFQLLKRGIESSQLTTDSGIDLVAYSRKEEKAYTIQVKTCFEPKPGGGKGRPILDWWVPTRNEAQLLAFVDLSNSKCWLIPSDKIQDLAQQRTESKFHFIMVIDPEAPPRKDGKAHFEYQFSEYLLENNIHRFF